MARLTPQWLQAGNYPGAGDRRLIGALWPAATVAGCAVTPSTGMAVNIAPGQVAVPTANATGSTLCTSTAVETITLDPAPPSGTNRVDLVICTARSSELDGGVNEDFIFDKVAGAPAASPAVPAVPAGSVALAQVAITGGSASLTAANITDRRALRLAVGSSGLLAVATVCPPTQVAVSVGGSYAIWDAALTIPFVAPASGAVLLTCDIDVNCPVGCILQTGFAGGGLASGSGGLGPAQGPATRQLAPTGALFAGRIHVASRIFGLAPGTTYSPALACTSLNSLVTMLYYGGNAVGGTTVGNGGPAVLTATAA